MITIRPYRAADRAACRHVFQRAVREGAAGFYDAAQRAARTPDLPPDPARPDKLPGQWAFVAEADGAITGIMSLDHDGYLDMAFVLPEVMGQGHAAALYDRVIARARDKRLSRLTVHASHLARRFFLRRGWRVEAAEQHPVGDQVLERFRMVLDTV